MNQLIKSVVFDFDYTLADSSLGAIECINFALERMGLPAVSVENIRRTIGLSLKETFQQLMGDHWQTRSDEFIRWFVQRGDQVMVERTVLFESVPSTVETLTSLGLSLGIVSTKFRYRIEEILRRERLEAFFEVIVGGEDVADHKPDPKGLLTAIQRMRRAPAEVIYVGDSGTDAETARQAGVAFVAVLSGVNPREAFKNYEVYAVIEDLRQLSGVVAS